MNVSNTNYLQTDDLRRVSKGLTMLGMAKKPDRHVAKPFPVRLHPVIRTQLEKLVEQNVGTTITAEIVAAIRKHLADNGLWPPKEKGKS